VVLQQVIHIRRIEKNLQNAFLQYVSSWLGSAYGFLSEEGGELIRLPTGMDK